MATVLVVDDNVMDRHRVGSLLKRPLGVPGAGLTVSYAADGSEALALIGREPPDLVLADLRMPGMNGLELVEAIKARQASLPIILMTAYGSEEVALLALRSGAAGYVPKRRLAADLLETVENVLEMAHANRGHQRVLASLAETQSRFVVDNDSSLVPHLVGHLRGLLDEMKLCDDNQRLRVSVALREALINAMHHGNLEVSSDLLETSEKAYFEQIAERRGRPPYRDRRVHVSVRQTPAEVVYTVRDEGPGFDPTALPDPTDPQNLERLSGRGLLLIRTFMDEVRHNESGNQITMVKRRQVPAPAAGRPPAAGAPQPVAEGR